MIQSQNFYLICKLLKHCQSSVEMRIRIHTFKTIIERKTFVQQQNTTLIIYSFNTQNYKINSQKKAGTKKNSK